MLNKNKIFLYLSVLVITVWHLSAMANDTTTVFDDDLESTVVSPSQVNKNKVQNFLRHNASATDVEYRKIKVRKIKLKKNKLKIKLTKSRTLQFVRASVKATSSGSILWQGELKGKKSGSISLIVNDDYLNATIFYNDEIYHITHIDDDYYAVYGVPVDSLPPSDHHADFEHIEQQLTRFQSLELPNRSALQSTTTQQPTIRIVGVYTNTTRDAFGGDFGATARLEFMASRLTDALDNNEMLSEVTVDYVAGVNIDYDEPATHGHLNILNDVTALEQTQQIKDYYGADMVAILVSDREYCGLAPVRATPSTNLFTVMRECVDYTFAHEFGHQMGALHNPEEDNSGTFNHGYLDVENGFRTIMAYDSPDNCCHRIPYFSTPTQYDSNGNPLGTSSTHDNERQLREYAPTAAALNDKNTKNIDAPVLQAFWDACLGLNDILWTQEWGNGPVTYKVYRSAYSSMNNKMLHATTSGTYSSVTLNYPGDSPYIAVQACDLDGCSSLSNVRKASYQNVCW